MENFAVIDTETNWKDQVMSIGIVVADALTLNIVDEQYYIVNPAYKTGGMYSSVLGVEDGDPCKIKKRIEIMDEMVEWLESLSVKSIYAYNAIFDKSHLDELRNFEWYDIMKVAAYKQHNPKLPGNLECCKTGRLKRNYGVEPMIRVLTGDFKYREVHNALYDARDELRIIKLIDKPISEYFPL